MYLSVVQFTIYEDREMLVISKHLKTDNVKKQILFFRGMKINSNFAYKPN